MVVGAGIGVALTCCPAWVLVRLLTAVVELLSELLQVFEMFGFRSTYF